MIPAQQLAAAILLGALLFAPSPAESAPILAKKFIFPPSIGERISSDESSAAVETMRLDDDGVKFDLILPQDWTAPESGEVSLTVHFHNPDSFAVSEHVRRGLYGPLIVAHLGTITPDYQKPFQDDERFGRWIKMVEAKLKEKGAPQKTRVVDVDISSYGAGYGAVRELLEVPGYVKIIKRLVLCDSMYASYEKAPNAEGVRVPIREHIDPWVNFARLAVSGEKTFVMTYTEIKPTGYASTGECAATIMSEAGGTVEMVELDTCAAANDLKHALLARGDLGNFHAWGYAGNDVTARMMHSWHLADIWKTLDEANEP